MLNKKCNCSEIRKCEKCNPFMKTSKESLVLIIESMQQVQYVLSEKIESMVELAALNASTHQIITDLMNEEIEEKSSKLRGISNNHIELVKSINKFRDSNIFVRLVRAFSKKLYISS